jgi:hypothetical protein
VAGRGMLAALLLASTPLSQRDIVWINAKVEVVFESLIVSFINLENLKRNKKASRLLQDLADLENLC